MKDWRRWRLIVGLLASIILAAGVANWPQGRQEIVEIPLSDELPIKYSTLESVASFWTDSRHVVCCFQGYGVGNGIMPFARRCKVYEYPSGQSWSIPALESNAPVPYSPSTSVWEYIGVSKDHTQLFIDNCCRWYATPALAMTSQAAVSQSAWKDLHIHDIMRNGFSHFEPAYKTPPSMPVLDRFAGLYAKAISPSGQQIAWVDKNIPAERFHRLRTILRKYHVLREQPAYCLWVSDLALHHARRVAIFGRQYEIDSGDVRWSPDEKHISCFSTSQAGGNIPGPNGFRLTIFAVNF